MCSHAEVKLSEGEVYDGTLECWLHGSCFDLRSGKPTGPPAIEPVPVIPSRRSMATTSRLALEGVMKCHTSRASTLEIRDLHVTVERRRPKQILRGVDLTVQRRRDPRLMGPNGSGKSTLAYAIAGHPKYDITCGQVRSTARTCSSMTVDERARAGLFLAMQYPVEVPGVSVSNFLRTAKTASTARRRSCAVGRRGPRARWTPAHGPGLRRAQRQRGLLRR